MTDMPDGRLIVGGSRREGTDRQALNDPYRAEQIAEIHVASAAIVSEAVERGRESAREVARMPAHVRADVLRRAAEIVRERADEIATTVTRQTGKALKDTRREADRATYTLRAAATAAETMSGEVEPADAIPGGDGLLALVLREPLGLVAAISPFNAPFNLTMHKVAAAFAAGNAVIVKPSSYAPLSAYQLADVMVDAGMPPGAISVLPGTEVGPALVEHPGVDAISFTGGTIAGRKIAATAGLKPVILELGGNSPNIVHLDADLDWAARALVAGGFSNTGQSCNSVQRIYAHASVVDELVEKLRAGTDALVVGDPLDPDTDVGTLVDEPNAVRVESWVSEAATSGATVVSGGRREGAAYWPTVLSGVVPSMKVCSSEIFGPVVSVLSYDDLDEVIAAANETSFGLQAAVFTRSLEVAFRAGRGIVAGGVMVNRSSNTRLDHLPFGGTKESGHGREGGRFSLEEMTRRKLLLIDPTMDTQPHPLARH
ncbi:MAG TPA: aldehyde dehydrogenase family protein [Candidatus Limnocylindrales bacterium]|nr:aldehyde dehydrogenase family protein [Candidatus Limnocylindrales bacterium]